jgi:hypothetical protein
MLNIVKWFLVAIGGLVIIYAILLFAGVFVVPVNMPYYMFPVVLLVAGIGVILLSLGIFSFGKKN